MLLLVMVGKKLWPMNKQMNQVVHLWGKEYWVKISYKLYDILLGLKNAWGGSLWMHKGEVFPAISKSFLTGV